MFYKLGSQAALQALGLLKSAAPPPPQQPAKPPPPPPPPPRGGAPITGGRTQQGRQLKDLGILP